MVIASVPFAHKFLAYFAPQKDANLSSNFLTALPSIKSPFKIFF